MPLLKCAPGAFVYNTPLVSVSTSVWRALAEATDGRLAGNSNLLFLNLNLVELNNLKAEISFITIDTKGIQVQNENT